jgi:hypothetical protein
MFRLILKSAFTLDLVNSSLSCAGDDFDWLLPGFVESFGVKGLSVEAAGYRLFY